MSPAEVPDRRSWFADAHANGVEVRTQTVWDLSYPLPMPRYEMACPMCREHMILKDWRYHDTQKRVGSPTPWRCDVRMKCTWCGGVQTFGVRVSRDMFRAARTSTSIGSGAWIPWRRGKLILQAAGYFDES